FATQEELNYHIQTEHPEVPPVAEFEVSDLVIYPTQVMVGETVIIACTVTNIGGEAGTKTIICTGDFVAQRTVTLAPGESTTVSFEVTPEVAKIYSVSVDGLYGSFEATEIGVPAYSVALEVSNMNPEVGEKISCWIDITNIGTAPGTPIVSFYIDGALEATRTLLPISPGETGQTYVGFSLDIPGTHILRVEADTAFDELTIEVIEVVPKLANIYGVVTFKETGAPLEGVKASVDGRITYSNYNGAYRIENLTPRTYTMTLEKEGYETLWDTVKGRIQA
ncbi:unnamed protein product, partial [marine sediment metagenome]